MLSFSLLLPLFKKCEVESEEGDLEERVAGGDLGVFVGCCRSVSPVVSWRCGAVDELYYLVIVVWVVIVAVCVLVL